MNLPEQIEEEEKECTCPNPCNQHPNFLDGIDSAPLAM